MVNLVRKIRNWVTRPFVVRGAVKYGKNLHVGPGSVVWAPHQLILGEDVYIGKHCTIEVDGQIGSQVLIANHVGIVGRRDHDFLCVEKSVRESPWIGDSITSKEEVFIGDDVWIGYGAIILSGVRIGRGAIVGAGAVVVHDLPSYAIAVGNPAKSIGQRFSQEEIVQHEKNISKDGKAV